MSFLYHKLLPGEDLSSVHSIRKVVFVEEQHIPQELDFDEDDAISLHVLVEDESTQQYVGTGRLTPLPVDTGVLSRISVIKSYRRKGLGKMIIHELESYAIEMKLSELSLSPHAYLEVFYQGLGYNTIPGEQSSVGEHDLLKMRKILLDKS